MVRTALVALLTTSFLGGFVHNVNAEKPEFRYQLPAGHIGPAPAEKHDDEFYRSERLVSFPGADNVALLFEGVALAPDDFLIVSDVDGQFYHMYQDNGPKGTGSFATQAYPGDTVRVELFSREPISESTYRIPTMEVYFQSVDSIDSRKAQIADSFRKVTTNEDAVKQESTTPSETGLLQPKVIYGVDDRREYYEVSNPAVRKAADAVAIMSDWDGYIIPNANGTYRLNTAPWRQYNGNSSQPLCNTEPFYNQPEAGYCTAFLVAPDLVLTAGHCTTGTSTGQNNDSFAFVFGFAYTAQGTINTTAVPASRVYRSKQIVQRTYSQGSTDYTLIRLDRPVEGIDPLPVRRSGTPAVGTNVILIGHPQGIPLKIAGGENTTVRSNQSNLTFFEANVDAYAGNSGSPILNAQTLEVEGMLVRGEVDVLLTSGCYVSNRLSDTNNGWEDGQRIDSVLLNLIPQIGSGNTGTLTLNPNRKIRWADTVTVTLTDPDLVGASSVVIDVYRNGNPAPSNNKLTLTVTGSPGTFNAQTNSGTHGALHGDTLEFRYNDQRGQNDEPVLVTVSTTVDNSPPIPSNIMITSVGSNSARIDYQTNEPAYTNLYWGKAAFSYTNSEIGTVLKTNHSYVVKNLEPLTTYHIRVAAIDEAGNLGGFNPVGSELVFSTTRPTDLLTQRFANGSTTDLANKKLRYVPLTNADGYRLEVLDQATYPTPPGGNTLSLGDDQAVQVSLGGKKFNFFQLDYTDVYISSNGNLTFGQPDSSFNPSNHTNVPRISPFFADLDPGISSGNIRSQVLADRFVVTYDDIRFWSSGTLRDSTRSQVELFFSTGEIHITHLKNTLIENANGAVVGISAGHGQSLATATLSDLSSYTATPTLGAPIFYDYTQGTNGFGAFYDGSLAQATPGTNGGLTFSTNNANDVRYGAWAIVDNNAVVNNNQLYRFTVRQNTSLIDKRNAAAVRLGSAHPNFSNSMMILGNSMGAGRHATGLAPRDYVYYFNSPQTTNGLIPSLQFLRDDLSDAATQTMAFKNMRIERFSASEVLTTPSSTFSQDLTSNTTGWGSFYPAGVTPMQFDVVPQGLRMRGPVPADGTNMTQGFWFREITPSDFNFIEDSLVEVTFWLQGTRTAPSTLGFLVDHPTVRLRVDSAGFESIAIFTIESTTAPAPIIMGLGTVMPFKFYYVVPPGMSGVAHNIGLEMYHVEGDGNDPMAGVIISEVEIKQFEQP